MRPACNSVASLHWTCPRNSTRKRMGSQSASSISASPTQWAPSSWCSLVQTHSTHRKPVIHSSHFSKIYRGIIKWLSILQCCNFSFTWRSTGRGATVSSILTARDRQATDINCCIQDLSCYNINKQTKTRNAMFSNRSAYTVVSNAEVQILTGRSKEERNLSM